MTQVCGESRRRYPTVHNLTISTKSHKAHTDRMMSQVKVVVAHTIYIPPQSELEILAKMSESMEAGTIWLLEGIQNKSSVVVARAVVSPTDDTIMVRLVNPQSESPSIVTPGLQ